MAITDDLIKQFVSKIMNDQEKCRLLKAIIIDSKSWPNFKVSSESLICFPIFQSCSRPCAFFKTVFFLISMPRSAFPGLPTTVTCDWIRYQFCASTAPRSPWCRDLPFIGVGAAAILAAPFFFSFVRPSCRNQRTVSSFTILRARITFLVHLNLCASNCLSFVLLRSLY